ncbi:MAG: hypothetical protein RBT22_10585 [Aliarcobacter sp.]|jgi:hypothetical protein|nr:hypothetical protein [Aliarcobacter sp.]
MKIIILFFIGTFLFIGCSSKPIHHTLSPNYENSIKSQENNTLIFIDSCIYSENIGDNNDNWSVYKSKKVNSKIYDVTKNSLQKKGFKINELKTPFMCGFFRLPTPNIKIKIHEDDDSFVGELPYALNPEIDKKFNDALTRISQSSYEESNLIGKINQIMKSHNLNQDFEYIKEITGQDKILVINNYSTDVSKERKIAQGVSTLVLSLGLFTYHQYGLFKTYVTLIDLNKQEVIWKTALQFGTPNFDNDDFYNKTYKEIVLESIGLSEGPSKIK